MASSLCGHKLVGNNAFLKATKLSYLLLSSEIERVFEPSRVSSMFGGEKIWISRTTSDALENGVAKSPAHCGMRTRSGPEAS